MTKGERCRRTKARLPIFLADLGVAVQDGIEVYGKENIHPGDVFLVNHPEICGQHLNNMAVYTPFFWDGKLLCFLAVRAHWIDVGGGSTGFGSSNTRDVYEEGLQVRSVKIYNARPAQHRSAAPDRRQYSFSRIVARRSARADRLLPHRRRAACSRSAASMAARVFKKRCEMIWDQTDKLVRQAVREIPDGVYEAASFLDDDGRVMNKTIPIKIKVEVHGDELTIDYSEVSRSGAGLHQLRLVGRHGGGARRLQSA